MSDRNTIPVAVERRLYAESMGKCMNPYCQQDLFFHEGDIIEKAHIVPYCKTADNSFENLVVLCPNCHTRFDKHKAFTPDEVLTWKQMRKAEVEHFFCKRFSTFEELECEVAPILLQNKTIYESYYLNERKDLWDKFESQIFVNNRKLKLLLENNLHLIQRHQTEAYSNLEVIRTFLMHVLEFEATRGDDEKMRAVLFPSKMNSIFGIAPVEDFILPSVEALETLVEKLEAEGKLERVALDVERPYIQYRDNGQSVRTFWDDAPRMRQLYFTYSCQVQAKVRLKALNYTLKHLRWSGLPYKFIKHHNYRELMVQDTKIILVYEYCLSQINLLELLPEENSIIVNLHNWNGDCCISNDAYEEAQRMNVTLMTDGEFREYIRKQSRKL